MSPKFRLIILGAGFSRPAGFPLAIDLWKEIREVAANTPPNLRAYKFNDDLQHYIEFRKDTDGCVLTPEMTFANLLIGARCGPGQRLPQP